MTDRNVNAGNTVRLHGRRVVGGAAEGEALVTCDTISGWGGVDPMDGTIIETRHELRGQSFKDKVLVFRGAKGSSGWSAMFHMTRLAGTAPRALVYNETTTKVALGAVVMRIPAMTDFDRDPLSLIETGDWVKVDADNGIVEVTKQTAGADTSTARMAAGSPLAFRGPFTCRECKAAGASFGIFGIAAGANLKSSPPRGARIASIPIRPANLSREYSAYVGSHTNP